MAQIGVDIGTYTFDASAQTITFSGVTISDIEQIKPIVNGERGEVIFNPATDGVFGTLAANVLTLEYDTTLHADTDELYICVNTTITRDIDVVESLLDGSTDADVQSVSIWFDGKNGTLDGVSVPDGYVAEFSPNGGKDLLGSIAYTVPDTKGLRVVISYVR